LVGPQVAEHLGGHPHTARAALQGFLARGAASFPPAPPGPEPDHAKRQRITARLGELLTQDRTWTCRPWADSLGPAVALRPRQVRRYLALRKAGHRRTAQTVDHKQAPEKVERAEKVPANLKKS
jgi:hypothetical protein